MENKSKEALPVVISPDALLKHWQGHRQLTRKTIEAFPEDHFFAYSIGNMRPFAMMAAELIDLAIAGMHGIVTGKWREIEEMLHTNPAMMPGTKQAMLLLWDEATVQINTLWPQIPLQRFQEKIKAFNKFEGYVSGTILYLIDNEIHHRGQGFVYLRALQIEPPFFWERN